MTKDGSWTHQYCNHSPGSTAHIVSLIVGRKTVFAMLSSLPRACYKTRREEQARC